MSKGHDRRENDLANFEAEFLDALERAKKEKVSAFIAERTGRKRGGATALDVELFTLESKIQRLREKLGLAPFEIPLPAPEARAAPPVGWAAPPRVADTIFPLDPRDLWNELAQAGRVPDETFAKVKCGTAKTRQGADQPAWRLALVECDDGRIPAKVTLTLFPLPDHPDAEMAAEKLHAALEKLVVWAAKARVTVDKERPRALHVGYTRDTRELSFSAR